MLSEGSRDYSDVWNMTGIAYQLSFDSEDALRCYLKALRLNPANSSVLNNLGTLYVSRRDFKSAERSYRKALKINPNSAVVLGTDLPSAAEERGAMNYYLASGCTRAGIIDRAVDYLRMALNERFTNPRKIMADSDFASLRSPAFEQLLTAERSQ